MVGCLHDRQWAVHAVSARRRGTERAENAAFPPNAKHPPRRNSPPVWLNALTFAPVAVAWWNWRRAVQSVVTVAILVLSAYYAVRFIPTLG